MRQYRPEPFSFTRHVSSCSTQNHARPNSPIYNLTLDGSVGAPLAYTCGGEVVLVLGRADPVGPFPRESRDAPGDDALTTVGYVCDLIPAGPDGMPMRRVLLRAADATPLPPRQVERANTAR